MHRRTRLLCIVAGLATAAVLLSVQPSFADLSWEGCPDSMFCGGTDLCMTEEPEIVNCCDVQCDMGFGVYETLDCGGCPF